MTCRVLTLLLFAVCATQSGADEAVPDLRAGALLVAASSMADYRFNRTVILLINHSENGALGIIVNKRSEISLETLAPELGALSTQERFTYFGGPVHLRHMSYLHRAPATTDEEHRVFDDVFWDTDLDTVKELLPRTDDASLRLFFGYAGWGPGQLEFELSLGHWHLVPAMSGDIFSDEVDTLWQRLSGDGPGVITLHMPPHPPQPFSQPQS